MKNILYEKPFLRTIKLLATIITTFLIVITSLRIYRMIGSFREYTLKIYDFFVLIENIIVIILSFRLIYYPHKIEYLAVMSFIYSFGCLVFDLDNPMGVLMYALGITALYVRGLFINGKKYKIFIFVLLYIGLLLGGIHFGLSESLYPLINKLGYTLVLSLIIILLLLYKNHSSIESSNTTSILNLANYPGLVENDVILLQKVLENEQYKNIATAVYRTEGTIRNRLNKIYDILGVMDRMGFISTYMGYEIFFQKEDLAYGNKTINNLLYKKKKKKF